MIRYETGILPTAHTSQFPGHESMSCPDCETRFPLQTLIAELLRKNQSLRIELQEARNRLARADIGIFGQESY
jgi:hypothetical protein